MWVCPAFWAHSSQIERSLEMPNSKPKLPPASQINPKTIPAEHKTRRKSCQFKENCVKHITTLRDDFKENCCAARNTEHSVEAYNTKLSSWASYCWFFEIMPNFTNISFINATAVTRATGTTGSSPPLNSMDDELTDASASEGVPDMSISSKGWSSQVRKTRVFALFSLVTASLLLCLCDVPAPPRGHPCRSHSNTTTIQ